MPADMLVKLYDLAFPYKGLVQLESQGITIRRAMHLDRDRITDYVGTQFSAAWKAECEAAFFRQPPTFFVAVMDREVVGFACYDCTAKGFFGPTGVTETVRGRGIGTALLYACLASMRDEGYAYAVIGWVSDAMSFYVKTVGAVPIPDSHPGVYRRKIDIG